MKTEPRLVFIALLLSAIAACSRVPSQHILQRNGHTVLVINQRGPEVIVTPWVGARPMHLAKGAMVSMPVSGGPGSWDFTIRDATNGKVIYHASLGAGGPRIVTISDGVARLTGPESGEKAVVRRAPARPEKR
ncbi:MAG: hypothetical protein QOK37_2593 [Thermoanaerobaculia bacterium]|jgi:hypothetical protein|nr:hypothetical protein [Thermoanaerobaculia bacterium]